MVEKKKEWFASWFDTEYYHLLYRNRNFAEAERFIGNLTKELDLPEKCEVLDLACGKGRHALTLHKLGFLVTGADLSDNSISCANHFATEGLSFIVHDMREVIPGRKFRAIFNLFTSFGYFNDLEDNRRVISAIDEMLEPGGFLVIDFMNASKVIERLIPKETKEMDGISFHLERRFDGTHIFKNIRFEDDGKAYSFTERVQALKRSDFERLLTATNLQILRIFGDFDLNDFDENQSDRLIIIAQKR